MSQKQGMLTVDALRYDYQLIHYPIEGETTVEGRISISIDYSILEGETLDRVKLLGIHEGEEQRNRRIAKRGRMRKGI